MSRQSRMTIGLLSAAHFVTDSYSSFLLPLLPLMAIKLGLTPVQAGLLIPLQMLTSSLMQPIYGMISDRYLKRSMSVYGPLIAAIFLSSIGLAGSLPMLVLFVALGGFGIGAFHPQSAAIISRAGIDRQATTMSVFSSSGTIGVAVGPLLIAWIVDGYGLDKSWYLMSIGIVLWVLLLRYCPAHEPATQTEGAPPLSRMLMNVWQPLTLLYSAGVLRSAVHVSVQTYLAFLLKNQGLSLTGSAWVISGFILFGGIGGLFGGSLADRFGARRVSLYSMLLAGPTLILALSTTGWPSWLMLAVGGTFLNIGVPVNVVMAQRLVPGGASTVAALMMGFAWGAGALIAPATGVLSEEFGFARALSMVSALTLVSAALLWRYPRDEREFRASSTPTLVTNS
ncbi:MAG: MFS transporter [Blastocatellales bacterium]